MKSHSCAPSASSGAEREFSRITAQASFDRDQLDFGFIAGANVIPNLRPMADMLPQELNVLAAAYGTNADAGGDAGRAAG